MNSALRIADQNHADILWIPIQNGLQRELRGLRQCLALIQNNEARRILDRLNGAPRRPQKWEDLLANGL